MSQFKKFDKFKTIRKQNRERIIKSLISDERWNNQFDFINVPKNQDPSYMVFPIFLNKIYKNKKEVFIKKIEKLGLETRPVISGSFTNQPSSNLFKLNLSNKKFKGAEYVQKLGFVIGLHTKKISLKEILFIKNTLFSINKI